MLYSLTGQFNLLSDLAMFTIWIFYTMLFIGVVKLRKTRPDMDRPYLSLIHISRRFVIMDIQENIINLEEVIL